MVAKTANVTFYLITTFGSDIEETNSLPIKVSPKTILKNKYSTNFDVNEDCATVLSYSSDIRFFFNVTFLYHSSYIKFGFVHMEKSIQLT